MPNDHIFVGRIIGIRDIVSFHDETVSELENSFKETVDDYLEACATFGQQPNKPSSGKLLIRVSAEIHSPSAAIKESYEAADSVNVAGKIIMPGLVNAHAIGEGRRQ